MIGYKNNKATMRNYKRFIRLLKEFQQNGFEGYNWIMQRISNISKKHVNFFHKVYKLDEREDLEQECFTFLFGLFKNIDVDEVSVSDMSFMQFKFSRSLQNYLLQKVASKYFIPLERLKKEFEFIHKMKKPISVVSGEIAASRKLPSFLTVAPHYKYNEEKMIDTIYTNKLKIDVLKALKRIPSKDRMVVKKHLGLDTPDNIPMRMDAIGEILKLSRTRIHQIYRQALRRLRCAPYGKIIRQYWLEGITREEFYKNYRYYREDDQY